MVAFAGFSPVKSRQIFLYQSLSDWSGCIAKCLPVKPSPQLFRAVNNLQGLQVRRSDKSKLVILTDVTAAVKGPKGMGPSGGWEATLSLRAQAWGWLAPSLGQPPTSWPWPPQTNSALNHFSFVFLFFPSACVFWNFSLFYFLVFFLSGWFLYRAW